MCADLQGLPKGNGKIDLCRSFLHEFIALEVNTTMSELSAVFLEATGTSAYPRAIGNFFGKLGFMRK